MTHRTTLPNCDAVHAILGEDEQDGDSSDKLLKEIEEEYNTADKTGPNINEHLANLINKRFAGKLEELRALCNQQIAVTDFLFGDHVQSSLKTIKECKKNGQLCQSRA